MLKTLVPMVPSTAAFTPAAARRAQSLYDRCRIRWGVATRLALPAMTHPVLEVLKPARTIDVRLTQNPGDTHLHFYAGVLYRLTNALTKVGLNHHLELSRRFARLSRRVSEEHALFKRRTDVSNLFASTRSLQQLISALRRAFSGNNLQLRQNFVSLMRDIHEAGQTHTKERSEFHKTLLLYHLVESSHTRYRSELVHRQTSVRDAESAPVQIQREVERAVARLQKEKPAEARPRDSQDIERVLNDFQRKLQRDQQESWRLEKLQRGLL